MGHSRRFANDVLYSAAMYVEVHLGDHVRLRKKHPCGSDEWDVVRLGADIGLVCRGCGRRITLPRGDFNKQLKVILSPTPNHQRSDAPE